MLSVVHNWPFRVRFFILISLCVLINVFGLVLAENIGFSVLFFDMIGTAIAALSGGALCGMVVAAATGILGAAVVDNDGYAIFSIVNMVGALTWAILPRLLGAQMFNPEPKTAYRRGLLNLVILGLAVGINCTIIAFVLQFTFFPFHILSNNPELSFELIGGQTSISNIVMTIALSKLFVSDIAFREEIILISSIAMSNVTDKIVATVSAVFLIFAFGTLPNFQKHRSALKENQFRNCNIIDNRMSLFVFLVVYVIYIFNLISQLNIKPLQAIIGFCVLAALICSVLIEPSSMRSVDRLKVSDKSSNSELFYSIPDDFDLKRQKDIFEDVLKMCVIAMSAFLFWLGTKGNFNITALVSGRSVTATERLITSIGTVNIIVLTAFRYLVVISVRMSGRV